MWEKEGRVRRENIKTANEGYVFVIKFCAHGTQSEIKRMRKNFHKDLEMYFMGCARLRA